MTRVHFKKELPEKEYTDPSIARDFRGGKRTKDKHAGGKPKRVPAWVVSACQAILEGAVISRGARYGDDHLERDGVRLNHKIDVFKLLHDGYLRYTCDTKWYLWCKHGYGCLVLTEKGQEVAKSDR